VLEQGCWKGLTQSTENLVKGVKRIQSTQVIAMAGNIKFAKCPLYP